MGDEFKGIDIAVLIPCFNEEVAIGRVVPDFPSARPTAHVNN